MKSRALYCWFLLIPWIICQSACSKHPDADNQSTYTFVNQTGKPITFDMYASKDDYLQNRSRTQQYSISPAAELKLALDIQKTYWIDWYSPDYSVSNWLDSVNVNRASPAAKITIASEDDVYALKCTLSDTTRSVLLNGSGLSSEWVATVTNVGAADKGTYRFLLRKDFSGHYIFTDLNGTVSQREFRYFVNTISRLSSGSTYYFRLAILDDQAKISHYLTCNIGMGATPHTGRDSMLLQFNGSASLPGTYPTLRQ